MSEPSAITGLPDPHVAMNAVGMPAIPSCDAEAVLLQDVDQVAVGLDLLEPQLAVAEDLVDHLLRERLHAVDSTSATASLLSASSLRIVLAAAAGVAARRLRASGTPRRFAARTSAATQDR